MRHTEYVGTCLQVPIVFQGQPDRVRTKPQYINRLKIIDSAQCETPNSKEIFIVQVGIGGAKQLEGQPASQPTSQPTSQPDSKQPASQQASPANQQARQPSSQASEQQASQDRKLTRAIERTLKRQLQKLSKNRKTNGTLQ